MGGAGGMSEAGLGSGLVAGGGFGLLGGLLFGFLIGRHHACWACMAATDRLSRRGRLPRRLMPFLDDAHRLGLLRTAGPVYQFRHAYLHDHLAATYDPDGE
ncbi:hypothetical protein ETD83_08155 [Actinomadura soli]|uniref:Uncharacterized protein n=2 Tax=Actinomadura soli TaxID=2508997 RepID=A0A5C4JG82_9ACTN|nr:hypothetical protein ETD83_08155 [Actinomadura soli]